MNRTATKRALLTSLMALILCISMFIGTTFAWFTDSVTSGKNKIVAGNLDVEVEYLAADGKWTTVGANTNVFMEGALWEPGHTEVVYLKVKNAGTLAFDYKLGVSIVEEVKSINVYDEEFKLSDYIVMGAVEDVTAAYADRAAARAQLNANAIKPLSNNYAFEGSLYPVNNATGDATEKYLSLVVYMPETVGNEANYKKGADVPQITLGLNVLATQETYEKDSFNNQYDKDANVTVPPVPSYEQNLTFDVYDAFNAGLAPTSITTTTTVYEFVANNYSDVYPVDEYANWTCDYFVSTDSAVDEGTVLFGNYGTFGWLGFWVPEKDSAYAPTGLLGAVSHGGESNWTYADIHSGVQVFRCGIVDHLGNNAGVKATVELRMTSPDKTQVIVVDSITVTLG